MDALGRTKRALSWRTRELERVVVHAPVVVCFFRELLSQRGQCRLHVLDRIDSARRSGA